ncbi:hypothetical protein [Haloechinothrix salitolerans]|uniref:Uncharacterized protein n=1 Tax=Haloechinothrix salitolerans TaxID=926830 RepID=A0ABW2BTB1_9PSEU
MAIYGDPDQVLRDGFCPDVRELPTDEGTEHAIDVSQLGVFVLDDERGAGSGLGIVWHGGLGWLLSVLWAGRGRDVLHGFPPSYKCPARP